jgi:putative DNA primase/helicase
MNTQSNHILNFAPIQWKDVNDRNRPLLTKNNVEIVLERNDITIRYNQMVRKLEITIPGLPQMDIGSEQVAYQHLVDLLNINALPMNAATLEGIINAIGFNNQYHPVREAIDATTWDGRSRIADVLDCLHTEQTQERDIFMTRWLISAVAALYEQTFRAEGVLVLQGKQGIKKTSFFKSILPVPGAYREGATLNAGNKDSVMITTGAWVVELGELGHTFRKSDIDALKQFITTEEDTYRAPYGRTVISYKRRNVFIGTVNDDQFLTDTENRRYWTVGVDAIDMYSGDVLQLWAEIKQLYESGQQWWLTESERELLTQAQKSFEVKTPIEEILSGRIDPHGTERELNATLLLQEFGIPHPTKAERSDAVKYLRKIGCKFLTTNAKYRFSIIDDTTSALKGKLVAFSSKNKGLF